LEALAGARRLHGLEALTDGPEGKGAVLVRGPRLQAAGERMLRNIPWDVFYEIIEEGGLRNAGCLLPEGKLPDGKWQTLEAVIGPSVSTPALPGKLAGKAAIGLRPDDAFREANLLQAGMRDWLAFGNRASEIRLQRLIWALDTTCPESVLIRGTPLPPVPGARFVEENGVAVPAGFTWWPKVSAESIRSALRIPSTELAILQAADPSAEVTSNSGECIWRRVPRTAWLPAKRSTIRTVSTLPSATPA